jgi:2-amino-4-hydroxy-6-hydroxymethyldihydropteridine diphosphokinase
LPVTDGVRWIPAYVGLGSNLDEPAARVREALVRLAALPRTRFVTASRLWRTRPVGPQDQPDFVNACAAVLTQLGVTEFHAALRELESALGKVPPAVRFGPRRIDLDLLVYGEVVHHDERLDVPHPRLHERAFVLYPLAEIAPDLPVPGRGRVSVLQHRLPQAAEPPVPF